MSNKKSASFVNVIFLMLAGVVNATGVALLLLPSQVIDGGVSGMSLLLSHVTKLNASIFIVCLNIPFFIFGCKKMGWMFVVRSLIAISVYALMTFIYTHIHLEDKVYELIGKDILLCAIFGGIVSGMGSGITIKFGGAIDGIDVMAVIFAKKIGITVGQFVMVFNIIMYIVASIVLKDLRISLYSVISYAMGLQAVDFIVNGFDKCKAVNIITEHGDELSKAISKNLGRGITLINAQGYYSKENKTMMYCVVNRFEVVGIKKLIKSIDKNAFVTVSEISDIMGSEIKRENLFKKKRKVIELAKDEIKVVNPSKKVANINFVSVTDDMHVQDENLDVVSAVDSSLDNAVDVDNMNVESKDILTTLDKSEEITSDVEYDVAYSQEENSSDLD